MKLYLNTIYYGRGAYGVETAARAYFGEDAKDLTASQAALLATVIRGPSLYDPTLGDQERANAEERWGFILDAMVEKQACADETGYTSTDHGRSMAQSA